MGIFEQISNTFSNNMLFQGGFLLGIFGAVMAIFKDVPKTIYHAIKRRVVYSVTLDESNSAFDWFEVWLTKHHGNQYNNVQGQAWNQDLRYKQLEDRFVISYDGSLIQVIKNRTKLENASNIFNAFYSNFVVRGFFAKRKITKLMEEASQFYHTDKQNDVSLHYYASGRFMYISSIICKDFKDVVLKDKQLLIDDIEHWTKSKEWYLRRVIPYKRGYLFYGKPGNGKTSTALTISKTFNKNLYIINLNNLSDDELKNAFMLLPLGSVLLIEDIDCAFTDRESDNSKQFSFSTLLNCLDGVFSTSDIITIFTTNHKERLDPALIRAGRIDFQFEISTPEPMYVKEYLEIFYNNPCTESILCGDSICMADVQNICLTHDKNQLNAIKEINKIYGK